VQPTRFRDEVAQRAFDAQINVPQETVESCALKSGWRIRALTCDHIFIGVAHGFHLVPDHPRSPHRFGEYYEFLPVNELERHSNSVELDCFGVLAYYLAMLEVLFATYAAVFVAEIVGDKLLYTSGVLATRFRWGAVVFGMSVAFMGKMAVAVLVGATIGKLVPPWIVAVLTTISFVGVAIAMWRVPDIRAPKEKDERILRGAIIAFTTIFFSEWGDKGMITAGVWSAAFVSTAASRQLSQSTVIVLCWAAAVSAMVTKGGLAITLGATVRKWIAEHISPPRVKQLAVVAILVLGILSVLEIMGVLVD
jgi:putative Ca2+/H+ antiporter (TMEM165/GDT1 family)